MSKPKKEYRVTVSYCEKTPEEAERLRRHITNVLYDKKMLKPPAAERKRSHGGAEGMTGLRSCQWTSIERNQRC